MAARASAYARRVRTATHLISAAVVALLAACGASPSPRRAVSLPDSFLSLEHRSTMSGSFVLITASATLDGEPLGSAAVEAPAGGEIPGVTLPVCLGRRSVAAGTHHLTLELTYAGHGEGVFSYLNEYRFSARSELDVEVPEDASGVAVVSTGYENGGVATPIEERPSIDWRVEIVHGEPTGGCTP